MRARAFRGVAARRVAVLAWVMVSVMQLGPDAQRQVSVKLLEQSIAAKKKKGVAAVDSAREVRLILPLPPSVNHSKLIGRYSTVKTRAWQSEAGWCVREQMTALGNPAPFQGNVSVSVRFVDLGDIDNRLKPLLDLLQAQRVFVNDKQVKRLAVVMCAHCSGCIVTVRPI